MASEQHLSAGEILQFSAEQVQVQARMHEVITAAPAQEIARTGLCLALLSYQLVCIVM